MGSGGVDRYEDHLSFLHQACELWEPGHSEVGYVARVFAQTSLPYQDPGDIPAWQRHNGRLTLSVQPGPPELLRDGSYRPRGYPYGVMPRLLLSWLATEAFRTQSRDLVLGESLADFLRQLGLESTGGKNGTIGRLRKHTERLFLSTVTVTYDGDPMRQEGVRMGVANKYSLWWGASGNPDQPELMSSYVRLSEEFFEEVSERPIPISLPALRLLKRSPLRLDLYTWLTYRMSYLRRRCEVPWAALRLQFGSQLADTKQGNHQFRADFQRHLAKVITVYPQANVEISDLGIVLLPSRTHVERNGRQTLTNNEWRRSLPR